MPRPLAVLLTTLALGLAACGEDDPAVEAPPAGEAAATTTTTTPTTPEPPAAETQPDAADQCVVREEPGGGKALPCPTPTLGDGTNVVTFETSEGSFDVTLDTERAPATANSVAYLAEEGFYDGLDFHRVIPEFVIQGGDPNGDGSGGPGYAVTEAPPSDLTYTRGVVAMAKGGADAPGASGSQFFVVTAADVGLPPEYALVGKVTKGMGVVDKITTEAAGEPPENPAEITSAKLKKG